MIIHVKLYAEMAVMLRVETDVIIDVEEIVMADVMITVEVRAVLAVV